MLSAENIKFSIFFSDVQLKTLSITLVPFKSAAILNQVEGKAWQKLCTNFLVFGSNFLDPKNTWAAVPIEMKPELSSTAPTATPPQATSPAPAATKISLGNFQRIENSLFNIPQELGDSKIDGNTKLSELQALIHSSDHFLFF